MLSRAASLCPALLPQPSRQLASGVPFGGEVRRLRPGNVYYGLCVGQWFGLFPAISCPGIVSTVH